MIEAEDAFIESLEELMNIIEYFIKNGTRQVMQ
jgi:aspartyl/asparaginyl-tRNA synthetase